LRSLSFVTDSLQIRDKKQAIPMARRLAIPALLTSCSILPATSCHDVFFSMRIAPDQVAQLGHGGTLRLAVLGRGNVKVRVPNSSTDPFWSRPERGK
jgi:hypothetical protein